ncbi:MAG: AlpA family phage regulatory protein [Pseudomonadota bacterium]
MTHRESATETAQDGVDRLLCFADARRIVGISRSKIYLLLAEGQFPSPVKIGRTNYFSSLELQQWISTKLSERVAGVMQ